MIHRYALEVFGLKGRLDKLRRELTEAVNAVDRYDENKGTIDEILQEVRDVLFVWQSICLSKEFQEANERNCWRNQEHESCEKLRQAIDDKIKTDRNEQ